MIQLRNVTLTHNGLPVLRNISGHISAGETVILVGETGSGKTSLIRMLYGELAPSSGEVSVGGVKMRGLETKNLPALRRHLGLIFQDDKLLDDRNVYDNIRFALSIQMKSGREVKRRAMAILAEPGLSHLRSHQPRQLSGGEAQRVGIARALANNPSVILADEPTGDLDSETAAEIFAYLATRRAPHRALLIATHDPAGALAAFPGARLWKIDHGVLLEY